MTTLIHPDAVDEDTVEAVTEAMQALYQRMPQGRIEAWYHDTSVWLFVGPGYPDRWQVLQVSVLLRRGEPIVEVSARTEMVVEGELLVPDRVDEPAIVALAKLSAHLVDEVLRVWEGEARYPSLPASGDGARTHHIPLNL